jgi:hypothetical protein
MRRSRLPLLFSIALLGGCSGQGAPTAEVVLGDPEASAIVFQAVDAGTGAALTDGEMTVRYLVRAPITLDASAVERVPSSQPYRVQHEVAEDSLVLEVRLEASSYHRLDTVLAVARGGSAGPYTVRMARRLGGAAPARAGPSTTRTQPAPAEAQPAAADPDAGIDRTPLRTGDQAFRRGDWVAATAAYLQMEAPSQRSSDYAREYQQGRIRQGMAHLNLNEVGSALDPLEEAIRYDSPGHLAYLHLGHAQCAVGRTVEGGQSLDVVGRMESSIPAAERPTTMALLAYHRAICSQQLFGQAESAVQIAVTGGRAVQAFESFIEQGQAMSPVPPEIDAAIADARSRIQTIRERMRGGGRQGPESEH